MSRRVVITGMGVVAPNATSVPDFLHALQNGLSGISYIPEYEQLKFNCQVTGRPNFDWEQLRNYVPEVAFHGLKGLGIGFGIKASIDAWTDAGLPVETADPRWDTGCIFGNSTSDSGVMKNVFTRVEAGEAKKLGSRVIEQMMNSGVTSYISGLLGLAGRVTTNSSACATGSQAVLMGYEQIKHGLARRMVVGSTENVDTYTFGSFDSMRVLARKFNDRPHQASRPMSATAGGFIPGSGSGALILEDLELALERGARIYAELKGGWSNSGGQRGGGSMTAAGSQGVVRCIGEAVRSSGIAPSDIDLISGHLTATAGDVTEIQNWILALDRKDANFPLINSIKSMVGHCLSAAGSIESVAVVLQILHQFVHPNLNLEDPNPEITQRISVDKIPTTCLKREINVVAKANFGFGDVNTCLIFSKFNKNG